jgi:hypothetical protein
MNGRIGGFGARFGSRLPRGGKTWRNVECQRKQRGGRKSGRRQLKTLISDRHPETSYWEYLEDGSCNGWEKLINGREEWHIRKYIGCPLTLYPDMLAIV